MADKTNWIIDYYNRAFLEFHDELRSLGMLRQAYLFERRTYWKTIPYSIYTYDQAVPILMAYSRKIESRIASIVSSKSYIYWMHVYRRIAPAEPMKGASHFDILYTRRIMEIAFQKYGKVGFCSHIACSKTIEISKIFNGLLLTPNYSLEKKLVEKAPDMLVLTDFGVNELREIYDLEKLCFEIHLINKTFRILGKGCTLNYDDYQNWAKLIIPDDLKILMTIYDNRLNINDINSSYLGVYFSNFNKDTPYNYCFFPTYNVRNEFTDFYKDLFHSLYKSEYKAIINNPNFMIKGFNIRNYYLAHKDASEYFYKTNGISFEAILIIIYFFFSVICSDFDKPENLMNFLLRGYTLRLKKDIISSLEENKKMIESKIGITGIELTESDFNNAISYLSFNPKKSKILDLNYCSLYYPFYEIENNLFIDFAWMFRTFLTLFFKLKMDDQNFKGIILEKSLESTESVLPTSEIKASDGTSHQIDYSFMKDDILFILECKVVSMSVDYERGVKTAIEYRTLDVVDRALSEIDIKAQWLIKNKEILKKYAPSAKYIVPIGISAFVEYIPSLDSKYWINDEIPRVLLPKEIENIRKNDVTILYNKIEIQ